MASPLGNSEIEHITAMLRTLGHETRLRLIDALRTGGEKSVGELDALTGIGQPALSQQLAVLRKGGLVTTRRVAKQVYYSVAPDAFALAAQFLGALAGVAPLGPTGDATPQPARPARGSAAMFAKILR